MLEIGIKGMQEIYVTGENTAKTMGSGTLDVFATPAMIALMENTAYRSIADELELQEATVGTKMHVSHVAATPLGMKVRCETELIQINGRALTFLVRAYDEAGLIGEGEHERFIINEDKFLAKANAKKER